MVNSQLLPTVKPQVRAHSPQPPTNLKHAGQIPVQRLNPRVCADQLVFRARGTQSGPVRLTSRAGGSRRDVWQPTIDGPSRGGDVAIMGGFSDPARPDFGQTPVASEGSL